MIDNGVGIAPEVMERLFGHGFTTRKSGHGFGLHSAALAAADLGGSLKADERRSRVGARRFTCCCPTSHRRAPVAEPRPHPASTSRWRNLNRRVLVIDDNEAIHEDFRKVLGARDVEGQGRARRCWRPQLLGGGGAVRAPHFELDSAMQGEEGVRKAEARAGRRAARMRWPSSTCACRRAGTG